MSRLSRLLASFVIVGVFLYLLIEVPLHFLRPDYNPARRFLSEYAVGRHGVLGTIAFDVLAATTAALAVILRLEVRRSWLLRVGCFLLGIVSLGFIVLALFPTDLSDPMGGSPPIRTATGIVHDLAASILSISLSLAALILPSAYRRDDRWRSMSSRILAVGLFPPLTLCLANLLSWQWRGIGQRLVVAAGLIWMLANAGMLLHRAGRPTLR